MPVINNSEEWGNSGDVKYHLGTTHLRKFGDGKECLVTLLANPSHLECVNPVVCGRTRAEQHYINDQEREKVIGIQIHGDAAFAG